MISIVEGRANHPDAVHSIQEMLNTLGFRVKKHGKRDGSTSFRTLIVDGVYGPDTESAVIDFQRSQGVLADGVIGPTTMGELEDEYSTRVVELSSPGFDSVSGVPDQHVFRRLPADAWGEGYDRLSLRDDVADPYLKVHDAVHAAGGLLTSSGGIRSLHAKVTRSRSALSFHYLGRALDLFIYSGMVDPEADPYVISRVAERSYCVHARCSKDNNPQAKLPAESTIDEVITYDRRKEGRSVKGHFLNLTELFQKHDFDPIRARRRFEEGGSMMGAEWWHFQYTKGLVPGYATFGQELLKLYSEETLEDTPPWGNRSRIYGVNWSPAD